MCAKLNKDACQTTQNAAEEVEEDMTLEDYVDELIEKVEALNKKVETLEWMREMDRTHLKTLYMSKEKLIAEYVMARIIIGHGYDDKLDTMISAYGGELIRREEMFGKGCTQDELEEELTKTEADFERQHKLDKEIKAIKEQHGNDYRVELNDEQKARDDVLLAHVEECRIAKEEEAKRKDSSDIEW